MQGQFKMSSLTISLLSGSNLDSPRYTDQLKAAHAVTVAAMKCKQSTDTVTASALEKAIHDLYRAYEGKEPDFH